MEKIKNHLLESVSLINPGLLFSTKLKLQLLARKYKWPGELRTFILLDRDSWFKIISLLKLVKDSDMEPEHRQRVIKMIKQALSYKNAGFTDQLSKESNKQIAKNEIKQKEEGKFAPLWPTQYEER